MKIKNHFLSRLLLTVCILLVVATSCRKDNGKTVAVSLNAAMQPFAPEMRDIMPKAVSGTATAEELKRFGELWQARVKAFLIDLADNPQFVIVREI